MIYLLVFIYLFLLSIFFDFFKVKGPRNFFYYLSMIILILIAGLRWRVGGDSLIYQDKFETFIFPIFQFTKIKFLEIGWEPGYLLVNSLSKSIVPEFWFFQLLQSIFINTILFRFFKRYTPYYFTAILLYGIFYYFYFNMEILREIIPICIFINWMYPALEKKDYKKYYLLNVILLFFHISTVVLLLIPFFGRFKLNRKGFIILGCISIGFISIFILFPGVVSTIALTDRMASKLDIYSKYSFSINGMIYLFLVFGCFPYFLVQLNKKYYKDIYFEKLIYPYFFIVAIYIAYSGFGRFINYFGPFMLVFFVNTIYLVMNVKKFVGIRVVSVILLLIGPLLYKYQYYSISYDYIVKGSTKFNMYYPYSSIFNKEDYYEYRLIIYTQSMSDAYNNSQKREK
ncbi:EpsG family protein [Chryseobacterium proteolyticum]|uniref:EpsG family protein n=1 Tax=Chryseobacterium proteolyticum TaxID=118127 RepID=UPI00398382D0